MHGHHGDMHREHVEKVRHRYSIGTQDNSRDEKAIEIIQSKMEIDELIRRKHHELAQQYGLSLEQFHLLIELEELMLDVDNESSAPTIGEIASSINNSQNTVSEKITRLENKKLVTRTRDLKDRRISRIVLTDEGRSLIEAISAQANNRFLFDSISKMEDADIEDLLEGLTKLLQQMHQP
jgi:DNA-binding MarR family transcriptional regulator